MPFLNDLCIKCNGHEPILIKPIFDFILDDDLSS